MLLSWILMLLSQKYMRKFYLNVPSASNKTFITVIIMLLFFSPCFNVDLLRFSQGTQMRQCNQKWTKWISLRAVSHKFYLVHSWVHCPKYTALKCERTGEIVTFQFFMIVPTFMSKICCSLGCHLYLVLSSISDFDQRRGVK